MPHLLHKLSSHAHHTVVRHLLQGKGDIMEGVLEIFIKGVHHLPPEEVERGGHLLHIMGNLEEGQHLRWMATEQE